MQHYAYSMTLTACLSLSFAFIATAQNNTKIISIESNKTMTQQINQSNHGSWQTKNKHNEVITLRWQQTTMLEPEFSRLMQQAWPIALPAYLPVEMDFLKQFPEVATTPYYKPCVTFFKNKPENIDWQAVSNVMADMLKSHFIFDDSSLKQEVREAFSKDTWVHITAHNPQGELLGFATFLKRVNYPLGVIKITHLAVAPQHQKQGLGKLLISSIFKIEPELQKLFLCTRVSNGTAFTAYNKWGFTPDSNPILDHAFDLKHWSFLSYNPAECNLLQSNT